MISYQVYKIIHLTGVFMVLVSLGGVAMNAINGGAKTFKGRKLAAITHGIGMLLSLVGGFGLLARLGLVHADLPGWAWGKLVIWLFFGGMLGILMRKPGKAREAWFAIFIVAAFAVYLVQFKPF